MNPCHHAPWILLAAILGWIGCSPSTNSKTPSASDLAAYPDKTIQLICPWNAGGGTDRVSRFLADELSVALGVPCVVQNKTGGSGAVGHGFGAHAQPDGYTLTMGTFELSTMHWMGISALTYEDYQPLLQVNADAAALIVRNDSPWADLSTFLAHIKANPGKVHMSGTAAGGAWDLARAGFLLAAGLTVDSVLWVPTDGSAPSLVELLGGHIDAVCCSVPEAAAQIEGGELRVLAVMAPERIAEYPDYPTVKESGVDWEMVGWRGLLLPKETPQPIVDTLAKALQTITASASYKTFMNKSGFGIVVKDPDTFRNFLHAEDQKWKTVIEATGYAAP